MARPRTSKLAELLFEGLGNEEGVIVNRVADDQKGWDYIVEYPQLVGSQSPESAPPAMVCLAQIKSTVRREGGYRLKLSNALRFSQHALPCFVIKFLYAADGKTLLRAACQHFWLPQIEVSLRAVRQAHIAGAALNQKKLSFPFDPSDWVEPRYLIGKLQRLVEEIPNYAATKQAYANTAGFETGAAQGNFTITGEQNISDFVDATLGLQKEVPVSDFKIREVRFGLPDKNMRELSGEAKLKITPQPISQCNVILSPIGGNDRLVLRGDMFVPAIPNLPPHLRKVRIVAEFVELICQPNADGEFGLGSMEASFEARTEVSLKKIQKVAKAFSWFVADTIEFRVVHAGKSIMEGTVNISEPQQQGGYWEALRKLSGQLVEFVEPLTTEEPLFGIGDFSDLTGKLKFGAFISGEEATCRFRIEGDPDLAGSTSYVAPISMELGKYTFFALGQSEVREIERQADKYIMKIGPAVIKQSAILRGSIVKNSAYLRAETENAQNTWAAVGGTLFMGFPGLHF